MTIPVVVRVGVSHHQRVGAAHVIIGSDLAMETALPPRFQPSSVLVGLSRLVPLSKVGFGQKLPARRIGFGTRATLRSSTTSTPVVVEEPPETIEIRSFTAARGHSQSLNLFCERGRIDGPGPTRAIARNRVMVLSQQRSVRIEEQHRDAHLAVENAVHFVILNLYGVTGLARPMRLRSASHSP